MQEILTTRLPNVSTIESASERLARESRRTFARFAWGALAYNVLVVLWGAFVRASYSGDGCGSHWPLCNGEVFPTDPGLKTIVEFSHRVTSGIALVLVALLVWRARALFDSRHPARRASRWALFFTFTEALIGAGLVVFGLVADDDSAARAASLSVHLVNTFLLLAALTLTAWWAAKETVSGRAVRLRSRGVSLWVFGGALGGMLFLGVSGAVAALGDTLFPASSLAHAWQQKSADAAHLLVRLRVLHPVIATAVALILLWAARIALRISRAKADTESETQKRLAWAVVMLLAAQMLAGAINVLLLAPVWMQIVHLLLADLLWIALVLLTAAVFAAGAGAHSPNQEV